MIKSLTVTNSLGKSLKITLSEAEPSHGLLIKNITGIGPSDANLNFSDFATNDGSEFNSARLEKRSIQITFMLVNTDKVTVEKARHNTYTYFPTKKQVRLLFETDERLVYCYGRVEHNTPDIFQQQELVTIDIVCEDPYFYKFTDGEENKSEEFSLIVPVFSSEYTNPDDPTDERISTFYSNEEAESTNLIPFPYTDGDTSKTMNGITFTVNADGSITVTGTSTYEAIFTIASSFRIPNGNYILNGSMNDSTSPFFVSSLSFNTDGGQYYETHNINNPVSFTITDETILNLKIYIDMGATMNETFYPMIRSASISDDTYVPPFPSIESGFEIGTYNYSDVIVKNVINDGDVETGFRAVITFFGGITGNIHFMNEQYEEMVINTSIVESLIGESITAGDVIELSTDPKYRYLSITHEGITTNILNALEFDNLTWLVLNPGDNLMQYYIDSGDDTTSTELIYKTLYLGV